MKIFLSYASQDRARASSIHRALAHQGHDVFFDREDLPPGEEFHNRVRAGIEQAELFVFLVSEHAIDPESYTLSELEIAQRVIERPHGRLLPVMLEPIALARLPEFLKSVTVLETAGDITAAVADAVHRIASAKRRRILRRAGIGVGILLIAGAGLWLALPPRELAQQRIGADGAPADLVPAGTFVMGDGEYSPRREVFVDAFYMDRFELTVARYARFLAQTGSVATPPGWEALDVEAKGDLPVVGVDWNDAAKYCAWAGRRLPTEAEWEKAARGTDARRYPWGDESPTLERANHLNAAPEAYGGGLHAVGSRPAGRGPYGTHDMAGNVNEWVADWYAEDVRSGDVRNPKGAERGEARVIRGGSRYENVDRLVASRRYYGAPDLKADDLGFRCAADAR